MRKQTWAIAGNKEIFDARPERLDIHDLPYRPLEVSLDRIYPSSKDITALLSQYIASRLILDPKLEEACTGVGIETVGKTLETIIGGKLRQPIVKLEN